MVLPYAGVWVAAWLVDPDAWLALALGLVATLFLVRMYSFFHDLTHNSMFRSRKANSRWGYLLGFLLFTPYRWWQRQHSLHHANTGNLDKRGPGEIYTMTLAEYERASRLRRLGYRAYRNPVLMLLIGPSLVFLFDRRFPQRGMSRKILFSVVVTNLALAGWAIGWIALLDLQTYALIQGTTLVAGGAIAGWMLYVQHQHEDTYYRAAGNANYHHVHHLSAKIPNYNLRAAHEEQPMFAQTPVVTVRSGIEALRLKLWDEERGRLVRFPARRARSPLPALQSRTTVSPCVDVDASRLTT